MADAAAHAAALVLTRETTADPIYSPLLYGDPADIIDLCENYCIPEAKAYAAKNFVDGVALNLDTKVGPKETRYKDVKFGTFDFNAAKPAFTVIDPTTATTDEVRSINAVRIETFRTAARSNAIRLFGPAWTGKTNAQMVARTTAALDRRVIGFRVQKNMTVSATPLGFQRIPLAPFALLNDGSPTSWSAKVEAPADMSKSPIPYGTMTVNIATSTYMPPPVLNSQILDIGVSSSADIVDQLKNGITATQVAAFNPTTKDIILDDSTYTKAIPQFTPPAYDSTPGSDYQNLLSAFQSLQANNTERAWPLYETTAGSDVTVTGFVAARITAVMELMDAGGTPYISLTLQPTLLETPTAFTDYSNRFLKTTNPATPNSGPPSPYAGYARIVNPYICRVRLVD